MPAFECGTIDQNGILQPQALPTIRVNVREIAAGMLKLFSDEERDILRFGMLSATVMDRLRAQLTAHFRQKFEIPDTEDWLLAIHSTPTTPRAHEFSLDQLVRQIEHGVCLELYKIGDLVV